LLAITALLTSDAIRAQARASRRPLGRQSELICSRQSRYVLPSDRSWMTRYSEVVPDRLGEVTLYAQFRRAQRARRRQWYLQ